MALNGLSLKLNEGDFVTVIGGNGAGKSTMLKSISGIVKPYRGKIFIQGKRLDKYKSQELFTNCLAMLPQNPQSLFVKKTVREDLAEMLSFTHMHGEELEEKILAVAKDVM